MKTSFDKHRLRALWDIELHEDVRQFGIKLLVGLGIILAIVVFVTYITYYPEEPRNYYPSDSAAATEESIFTLGLYVLGCISATYIAAPLGKKDTAISMLMLPASNAEKFLLRFLVFVPGFFICYYLGIVFIDFCHYAVALIKGAHHSCIQSGVASSFFMPSSIGDFIIFLTFFLIQSAFALGSSLWPKHGIRNTVGAVFLLTTLYSIFYTILASIFPFKDIINYGYDFDFDIIRIIWIFGLLVMTITNYVLTYYRIKEAEIINRF